MTVLQWPVVFLYLDSVQNGHISMRSKHTFTSDESAERVHLQSVLHFTVGPSLHVHVFIQKTFWGLLNLVL